MDKHNVHNRRCRRLIILISMYIQIMLTSKEAMTNGAVDPIITYIVSNDKTIQKMRFIILKISQNNATRNAGMGYGPGIFTQ